MDENQPIDASDAPLLELQIQIAALWNDRKSLRAENKELEEAVETIEQLYNALKPVNAALKAKNEKLRRERRRYAGGGGPCSDKNPQRRS
jgi:DNA repair exonuclease SbcCD ATPase subunit